MEELKSTVVFWQGLSLFDPEASSRLATVKFNASKIVSVQEQIADSLKTIGTCENFEAGVADKQELTLCYRGYNVTPAPLPTCFHVTRSNGTLFDLRMEPKSTPLGPQSGLTLRECRVIDANTSKFMMRVHEYHLKGINTHCYALVFSDVHDEKLGQAMKELTVEADANNCHRYLANANAHDVSLGLLCDERQAPAILAHTVAQTLSSWATPTLVHQNDETSPTQDVNSVKQQQQQEQQQSKQQQQQQHKEQHLQQHQHQYQQDYQQDIQQQHQQQQQQYASDSVAGSSGVGTISMSVISGGPLSSIGSQIWGDKMDQADDQHIPDDDNSLFASGGVSANGLVSSSRSLVANDEKEDRVRSILQEADDANPTAIINQILQVYGTDIKKVLKGRYHWQSTKGNAPFQYVLSFGTGPRTWFIESAWLQKKDYARHDVDAKLVHRFREAANTDDAITDLVDGIVRRD